MKIFKPLKGKSIHSTRGRNGKGNIYAEIWEGKTIRLHRHLLGLNNGDKFFVDHVDGKGLNNCRGNLRLCTPSQNSANRKAVRGASNYKGVSLCKQTGKWRTTLEKKIDDKRKSFSGGRWNTEVEAAEAYNKLALKHFGEFAHLNELGE